MTTVLRWVLCIILRHKALIYKEQIRLELIVIRIDGNTRERIKQNSWQHFHDPRATEAERLYYAEEVFSMWFARSIEAYGDAQPPHPSFPQYIAMLLSAKEHCIKNFGEEVYSKLVARYGIIPDEIAHGASYYYPPDSEWRRWQYECRKRKA